MTTFISYSRVHSEFVVRLAKDLKSAGFDVWLDQLDIPKGGRWDDAIEAAVERSSTFMIVLSPESIESQNVKDELSYAIDAGKNILPVVIKPCKIPLRLRRFQYVDFTDKPYKESLADIKRLLSHTRRPVQTPVEQPAFEQPETPPVFTGPLIQKEPPFPQQEPPFPYEALQQDEPEKANPLRKFLVPVILGVIALAAIIGGFAFAANRTTPRTATLTLIQNSPTGAAVDISAAIATPIPPPPEIFVNGVTMRLVSASDFTMGSESMEDEQPVQTLYLDTFYIDKYEVTNALYRACVEAGECEPPKTPKKAGSNTPVDYYDQSEFDHYPVVYVDWNMARTYCEWRDARLPTEAEWEKAARGTDGRTYPWGEEISSNQANFFGSKGDAAPVISYENGRSAYGVYNMAGNVSEWVSSLYMPYPYDPFDGREDLSADGERVLRGGSWLNSDGDNEVRSARRHRADPTTAEENIGFRCAFSAAIPETGALLAVTPLNASTATHVAATMRSVRTREAKEATVSSTPMPGATQPPTSTLPPGATTAPATEPIPTEPTEPIPTEPTEPIPTEPIPTEPTEPIPTEPIPTEPDPTEPVPTEPQIIDPQPTEPPTP